MSTMYNKMRTQYARTGLSRALTLLLGCMTLALAACSDDDEQPLTGLQLDVEELCFTADGGQCTTRLTAGQEWTVMSDKEWCMVSPANGNGSTICEIRVDSSYLYDSRQAHLTFRCGKYSRQITIDQLGYQKVIKLEKDTLQVPDFTSYDTMYRTFKVTANVQYDVQVEYADPNQTGWLTVTQDTPAKGSIPRPATVRVDYQLYTESAQDRVAYLVFRQTDAQPGETPVESRLEFRQLHAQEIIPSRQGDSLAVLAIARIMRCSVNWDPSTPMIYWNNLTMEEVEYVNQEGKTVEEMRVTGLRFTMFNTRESIPYQIRKLDQLRTLVFVANANAAGKNIELLDDVTYLPHLKSLCLLGYGISKLPERMKTMTNLEELELSGNNFRELPIDLLVELDKHRLEYLNLSNNRVKDVYGKLYDNRAVKDTLGLHGTLPEALFQLKNLKYLGLSYNYFEGEVPDMGYDASQYATEQEKVDNNPVMPQLEHLAINLNFFTGRIPDWILYHPNLQCWDPYTLVFNQYERGKDSQGVLVGFSNEPSSVTRSCPFDGSLDDEDEEEPQALTRANSFVAGFRYGMDFDAATGNYPIPSLEGGWSVNYQPMKKRN